MDELVWLVLLVLAFPVMAIVALVLSLKHRGRIRSLEEKVAQLDQRLQAAGLGQIPPSEALVPPSPPGSPLARFDPRNAASEAVSAPGEAVPPPPDGPGTTGAPPLVPAQVAGEAPRPTVPEPAWMQPRPPTVPLRERFAGFEERLGARWAVWVGGIALALGGVFLVRYAVEQDLIGPLARVVLGLLLAALLLGAGEWLRRVDRKDGFAGLPAAHVPSVLTAAGTMTAFGSLYAAYELYHLIAPGAAFVLLALTGIATVFAALLHGPALAVLGFAGAAATPLLVTSSDPNAYGVAILIIAVGASALAVARLKRWRLLALLAVAGMAGWGLALLAFEVPQATPASGLIGLVLLALTAALLTPGHLWGPPPGRRPDLVSSLGAAGAVLVALAAAVHGGVAFGPLAAYVAAALGALALAWRAPAATLAALAVALTAPVILGVWDFPPDPGSAVAPAGPVAGSVPGPSHLPLGHFIAFGFALAGVQLALGLLGARRAGRAFASIGWAGASSLGAVLLLVAAYERLTDFEKSVPFAALGLLLALVLAFWAESAQRARPSGAPAAAFAAGSVVSLALALAFALEKGWLTVGLALAALAVAWVATKRTLPGLRQLSAGLGLLVAAHVGADPTIAGDQLGTTPIFNWLLWGYGVPAAAFAASAHLLGRTADDWPRRVHEGLALLFAVLLAALEVFHLAHPDQILAERSGLFETGLLASIYGAYAVGLLWLAEVRARPLYGLFARLVGALAALFAVGTLIGPNPFATKASVGGPVFNDLLTAYALPAILALLFAARVPASERPTRLIARGLAVVLGLAYVTFEVSRLFQGPVLDPAAISSAEWYAYSAAWLGFGILLLALGLWRRSRTLRLASAAVMVVTVLKVFLSDMSDLEGALRAFSFIGLGLVLVAMGWLYQRLLARDAGARKAPPPAP
ncbi:DUF2339 domain-containing protein [Xanthobacter pseudotagetidis]|uniref:DUF2339 domain-containing protein n=1 Tax=Xanthobacter pseudotagetidis TaxID=3119911 RepID=UPI003726B69D